MKKYRNIAISCFVASAAITAGCDQYERTAVEPGIYVNQQEVSLFVGEEIQLTASPANGNSYEWTSEDTEIATVSNGLVKAVAEGQTSIIVTSGDAKFTVDVKVSAKIPLTDIKLSSTYLELVPGASEAIKIELVPADANDFTLSDFAWTSDDESVARVSVSGNVTAIKEGATTLHYRRGNITKDIQVVVSLTRPFNGPHVISASETLILPMCDFDIGGEGVAFHESDESNSTGSDDYRTSGGDDGSYSVEVENGVSIGYTADGEWLLYTVVVEDAGTYNVQLNSSGGNDGKFHIEIDGIDATGVIDIPANGSWSNWRWFPETPIEITFTEGTHKIKFYVDQDGFNCKDLKFEMKQ